MLAHLGYVLYIPDKEQLIQQVGAVLKKWYEDENEDKTRKPIEKTPGA